MSIPDWAEEPERNSSLKEFRLQWRLINACQRFEQMVVLALSLIIMAIIVMAVLQLYRWVVPLLIVGAISTVLIAMEFKNSIVRAALRRNSIVQVRTVLLIALLALSQKFVVLDSVRTPASNIAALGIAALVLGLVCWLLRALASNETD